MHASSGWICTKKVGCQLKNDLRILNPGFQVYDVRAHPPTLPLPNAINIGVTYTVCPTLAVGGGGARDQWE